MFTGLIQGIGEIVDISHFKGGLRISVKWDGFLSHNILEGASVSLNGSCLSVESIRDNIAGFIAIEETVNHTTLKSRKSGDRVNIELPVTAQTFLDGHIVQGHVDCIGRIKNLGETGAQYILHIAHDKKFSPFIVEKGSIAVDGISLTVTKCGNGFFKCAIIPDTMKRTILSGKKPGDTVNLEFDIIAKYVRKLVGDDKPAIENEDDIAASF